MNFIKSRSFYVFQFIFLIITLLLTYDKGVASLIDLYSFLEVIFIGLIFAFIICRLIKKGDILFWYPLMVLPAGIILTIIYYVKYCIGMGLSFHFAVIPTLYSFIISTLVSCASRRRKPLD